MGCGASKGATEGASRPQGVQSAGGGSAKQGRQTPEDKGPARQASMKLRGTYYDSSWETCLGLLMVNVKSARDLPPMDKDGKGDPFCVISFGQQSFKTKTINDSDAPVWEQQAVLCVDSTQRGFHVKFDVVDKDQFSADDLIGSASTPIAPALEPSAPVAHLATGGGVDHTFDLQFKTKDGSVVNRGKLTVSIGFVPKETVAKDFWQTLSRVFDENDDGSISREELSLLMAALGAQMDDTQLDEMFTAADQDKDGNLSREELYSHLHQKGDHKFINLETCPVCKRTLAGSENDIIMHLAQCFAGGEDGADRFIVGNFLCADHAVSSWMGRRSKVASFEETQGKGYILVQDRQSGIIQKEKLAPYVTMPLRIMYQSLGGRFAANKCKKVLEKISRSTGARYDLPGSKNEIANFIQYYDLNVEEMLDPVDSFKTFNEFFYRKLKPEARPIAALGDDSIAVSPADCRCLVFDHISDATELWIKGKNFTLPNLIGEDEKELIEKFTGGALMIARLAPQDYHRFHFPVSGKVGRTRDFSGTLYTVSPLAINEPVDVYTENKRTWTEVHTEHFGTVLIISVGATMVGSIRFTANSGDVVTKGDEHGYFAFGGSTELILFEQNRIKFDQDLLGNSHKALEVLIAMGNQIGVAQTQQSESVAVAEVQPPAAASAE